MGIQFISPTSMAPPRGHYTPGVVHDGIVYVSGQLPFDKEGQIQLGSIEDQTVRCLYNIEQVLLASQSDLNHILKINIYVHDISLWPRINGVYSKIMGDHKPARTVVPCLLLHYGSEIEIDCIAAIKNNP